MKNTNSKTEFASEQRKADLFNATVGSLNEIDGYNCPKCKNRGNIAVVQRDDKQGYWTTVAVPCKCMVVHRALDRLKKSGLQSTVGRYTFDNFSEDEPWQREIKKKAADYCKDTHKPWLFIGGQSGAGKTHICTAVAVWLIKHGHEVRYMLWRDDVSHLKATANTDNYLPMLDGFKHCAVLYIDDLFKAGSQPTQADINIAFELVNYRYNNRLQTIISSERTLPELSQIDEATAGRIAEMAKGFCIVINRNPKRNWRMREIANI